MEQLELQVMEEREPEIPEGKPPSPSRPVGKPPEEGLRVYLDRKAYRRMREYGGSETSRELGGVLVGRVLRDERGIFVVVEAFIEAEGARSSKSSVTFTHEAWEHIHKVLEERYPGRAIVGWFHTHPGFGVFLSGYDRFIHQHFFREPWQVAMVLDPVAEEDGLFCWVEGKLDRVGGFYVFGEGVGEAEAAERALERAEQAFEEAVRARRSALRVAKRRDVAIVVVWGVSLLGLLLSVVANLRLSSTLRALRREIVSAQEREMIGPKPAPLPAVPGRPSKEAAHKAEREKEPPREPSKRRMVYVVRKNDTLWDIARRIYGDPTKAKEIAEINGLDPRKPRLKPGMKLILPP